VIEVPSAILAAETPDWLFSSIDRVPLEE